MPLEIKKGEFTPIYDKSLRKNRKRSSSERILKFRDLKLYEDEINFILICTMIHVNVCWVGLMLNTVRYNVWSNIEN